MSENANPLASSVKLFAPHARPQCRTIPASIVWCGSGPTTSNDARHMANALLDIAAACDRINSDAGITV